MLPALAAEPVLGARGCVPLLVLLAAEAEPHAPGRGTLRKAVAGHPRAEGQVVGAAQDGVPVGRNHPHAPQVVPQEILHLSVAYAAAAIDKAVFGLDAVQGLASVASGIYQRTYVPGNPSPRARVDYSHPRPVGIEYRGGQIGGRSVPGCGDTDFRR